MTTTENSPAAWVVDHFAAFWARPDPYGDASRISPEIVGRWPDGAVLRGSRAYRGKLVAIGTAIPDIRLDVLEHAVNDDIAFIRWRGHGTGANGVFEIFGVDRIRVADGQIIENVVHFDTAAFEAAAGFPLPQ